MNVGIQQRYLHAPVDTDEMRDQLGEVTTLLVVGKVDIIGTVASSVGAMTSSGAKEAPVSAETQAWLLSKEAQEVEANFRDAINHEDVFSALMVLTRSRNGIFMHLLVNRNSIGSSELWKRPRKCEGRCYQFSRLQLHPSAGEGSDPATENELIQPDKLDTLLQRWPSSTCFGARIVLQYEASGEKSTLISWAFPIKPLQRGSNAITMFDMAEDKQCGDFTQNTFVATYLEAAFHLSGYKTAYSQNASSLQLPYSARTAI